MFSNIYLSCADDVLENVNMLDDSKAKHNIEKRKTKGVYTAYDDDEFDEDGNPKQAKSILSHYDEEIEVGVKYDRCGFFLLWL